MLNKMNIFAPALFLYVLGSTVQAQDSSGLLTLFTTPEERQVINNNRYKNEDKPIASVQQPREETVIFNNAIQEEVNVIYKISGISINMDGSDTVWINDKAYTNGDRMDGGEKISINNGRVKTVTITTPDKKTHTGTSGEILDVTYLRISR